MDKNKIRAFIYNYGIEVKTARVNMGLTQLELARLVPCSQAIISHIERGYMIPPPHIENAIHTILKVEDKVCMSLMEL